MDRQGERAEAGPRVLIEDQDKSYHAVRQAKVDGTADAADERRWESDICENLRNLRLKSGASAADLRWTQLWGSDYGE